MKVRHTIEASDDYDHQAPSLHFTNVECGTMQGVVSLFFVKNSYSLQNMLRSQVSSVPVDDNEAINWISNDVDQQQDIGNAVEDIPWSPKVVQLRVSNPGDGIQNRHKANVQMLFKKQLLEVELCSSHVTFVIQFWS